MKKAILLTTLIYLINTNLSAQEKNFAIRTGVGYYMDTFTGDDGPIFWFEGGFKFKTGFLLNCRMSMASIDWKIREGAFKDYTTIQVRQMGDITFSKPILLKGNHFLEPGVGFKIKKEYLLLPSFSLIPNSGGYQLSTSYSEIFYEIGLDFYLDYYYLFDSGFILGFRADTNVIWALGFEGLTLSPLFGFRF